MADLLKGSRSPWLPLPTLEEAGRADGGLLSSRTDLGQPEPLGHGVREQEERGPGGRGLREERWIPKANFGVFTTYWSHDY